MKKLFLLLMFVISNVPAAEPVILVLGDSLSAAYGIERSRGWVALLQDRLQQAGYPHRVVNASISGDTTAGGLSRLPQALEQFQPDILIIELGGNDGLRGLGNDQTRDHLDQMITLARAAHSRPLLLGMMLPPNFGKTFTEKFLQIYRDLAEQRRVPLVPFFLEGVADRPDWMQGDGIHPNAAGQPLMLEHVWAQLQPLLDEEMAGGMGSAHSPTILK
ncbi:arylesterase [Sedimenticola selenatireducens]|uniref:Arylesterase n=1 Tax=Sedimenticola selenatireducens TaxID=191960 RepID=A0A2N6D0J3_9GAMM|nr:arylesterase [Sedimenticola selenatireducens]PLX63190.1 MAG: arylesterase [Sedimenticola selenatireducens]